MGLIDDYIEFKANPDNDKKDDSLFCSTKSISLDTLQNTKREHPKWAKAALERRRSHYAERMVEIDRALFLAAKSGDTKAADLLYRRFDNWNPKIVEQTNNIYTTFTELVRAANSNGSNPKGNPRIIRKSEE